MPTQEDLPDDITALKRIIADMARDAVTARAEIAKLKFQLARYRRAEFGRSSEKLARETEQLELTIEALETRPGRAVGDRCTRGGGDRREPGAKAGPSAVARSPAARGGDASRCRSLPELRWRSAADR